MKRILTAFLLAFTAVILFTACASASEIRPIPVDPSSVDPDNGEFSLTVRDADRIAGEGYFTAALYLEDRYDAAEIESLAPGDTIIVNRNVRTVKEIDIREEHSDYEIIFEEMTEGFEDYIALWKQTDGTYMALVDDWCPVTPVGRLRVSLPLPDDFEFITWSAGEEMPPEGPDIFIRALTEYGWEMSAYNTSCVIKNGQLVRVTHSGYPQGPDMEESEEDAESSDGTPVWQFCHGLRDGLETAVIRAYTTGCEEGLIPAEITPEEAENIRRLAVSGMVTVKANDMSVTGGTWVYTFEDADGRHLLSIELYKGLIAAVDGMYEFTR